MSEKKTISIVIFIIVAGLGGYLYWFYTHQLKPVAAQKHVAVSRPAPKVRQVVETPPAPPPMPTLADSDSYMTKAISGLVGNEALMKYVLSERIIRNIVVTIDNLPRHKISMNVIPVKRVSGQFIATGPESNLTISPRNAARYTPYVQLIEALDTKELVALYLNLYPLFQQAYEELGYPNKYFNDRLIETLDNLLAAPDLKEPVRLVQPKVFYQYADPDLERRSIGQRILMRMGSKNEAAVKAKLGDIKQELLQHMHEQKLEEPKAEPGTVAEGRITRAPAGTQ